jgi:hypothetical protein
MSDGVRETVEQAWLAAGKRGDVQEMRRLRASHPQWLDLQRVRLTADQRRMDSARS